MVAVCEVQCILSLSCRVNDDDLLPVDLSAMLGQHSITRLLLGKAAKDSSKCEPSST